MPFALHLDQFGHPAALDFQAPVGVKTTCVNLEDVGLPGNGHQMMSEKNSAEIAKYFMSCIEKKVR